MRKKNCMSNAMVSKCNGCFGEFHWVIYGLSGFVLIFDENGKQLYGTII